MNELQDYVAACRASGMGDDAIESALLSAGWDAQTVTHVLSAATPAATIHIEQGHLEPAPAQVTTPRRRRTGVLIGVLILVLVLGVGVTGVLGEMGYLPAISRIYRKTNIPFLWHGTSGNAALSLALASAQTANQPKIRVTSTFKGTADIGNATNSLVGFLGGGSPSSAHADVSSASKPVPFDVSLTTSIDPTEGVGLGLRLGLTNIPEALTDYIKAGFDEVQIEGVIPATGTKGYVRTNVLPTPRQEDTGKWFSFDIVKDGSVAASRDSIVNQIKGDSTLRNAYITAINSVTVDKGIIRQNGQAVAWYQTTLTPDSLKQVAMSPGLPSDVQASLTKLAEGWKQGSMVFDWYVPEKSPMVSSIHANIDYVGVSGYTVSGTLQVDVAYGNTVAVPHITQGDTWASPAVYFKALQDAYPNYINTGILSQKAIESFGGMLNVQPAASGSPALGL